MSSTLSLLAGTVTLKRPMGGAVTLTLILGHSPS